MKLVVSLIGALLLLFVDFAIAEHHHEDHELHIDCSVCIIQHSQIDTPGYKPVIPIRLFVLFVEKVYRPQEPAFKPLVKNTHGRAPPSA